MKRIKVSVQRLDHSKDLPLPKIETDLSAGVDLSAAVNKQIIIAPGESKIIPTGLAIALPAGFEAQVRPRSGLASKNGVTILNSPGTIDADYRGEIGIIIINHGTEDFTIERGMRIAQMIVAPVVGIDWDETDLLPKTKRGTSGFGSTGVGIE
ncbi:MAG: dUTP diphosphatase [Rhodospirillales bacterium]|jgi:dUTP pyrophosphatase